MLADLGYTLLDASEAEVYGFGAWGRYSAWGAGVERQIDHDSGDDGPSLEVKPDTRFTHTASDAARDADGGDPAAAEADVWLVRDGLEASSRLALAREVTLTPSFRTSRAIGGRNDHSCQRAVAFPLGPPKKATRMAGGRSLLNHIALVFIRNHNFLARAWVVQHDQIRPATHEQTQFPDDHGAEYARTGGQERVSPSPYAQSSRSQHRFVVE